MSKYQNQGKAEQITLESVKKEFLDANGNDTYKFLLRLHKSDDKELKLVIDKVINSIEQFVQSFAKDVSPHQIRNIYSQAQKSNAVQLKLLRPKLAYIEARQDDVKKRNAMKRLVLVLDDQLRQVDDSNIDGFKIFFETVVAYHKFYGKN